MTTPELHTTIIKIESGKPNGCTVYFEPDGAHHELPADDTFRVEARLPAGFEFEIWHEPDSITIYAECTYGLRAWRRDGTELKL